MCARLFVRLMLLAGMLLAHAVGTAAESAVIFMYHHVAEDTPPSTSVTPERFTEQLDWLAENAFVVLPLTTALQALRNREALPERAVVITFDDAYPSVLSVAAPQLQRRGWPFTVFVSTDYIDSSYGGYLSWDELRALSEFGATIGNHTRSHTHLVRRNAGETRAQWEDRITDEIRGAAQRLATELGAAAIEVFAYPFGEYDHATRGIVADLGLIALGQHSGAAGYASDWQAVPRFPVATGFDSLEDFAVRARSRPLVIELPDSPDNVISGGRPVLDGVLRDTRVQRDQLACFASNQGRMQLEWIDIDAGRFTALPNQPLQPGRSRYNCTAPSASAAGVYHWFSYPWIAKRPDGSWVAE